MFSGADFIAARDEKRLVTQLERIRDLISDGEWRTVSSMSNTLTSRYGANFPENSVQAQLRNLRKLGLTVDRRYVGSGLYEYRLNNGKN